MKEKMTLSPVRGEGPSRNRSAVHPAGSFETLGLCAGHPLEDGRAGSTCLADLESRSFCCSPPPPEGELTSLRVSEPERGRQEKMF